MNVKFKTWDTVIKFAFYANNRTSIQLMDAHDGRPIATATVNLPDEPLDDNEICIKDYSENAGMLAALRGADIISSPKRWIESGWVSIPVCDLLVSTGEIK